eukprot:m.18763 g.18763  ORF g.18763 m.18763 type:complete len:337 (-) comp10852_c1_seq13:87-1097(-)
MAMENRYHSPPSCPDRSDVESMLMHPSRHERTSEDMKGQVSDDQISFTLSLPSPPIVPNGNPAVVDAIKTIQTKIGRPQKENSFPLIFRLNSNLAVIKKEFKCHLTAMQRSDMFDTLWESFKEERRRAKNNMCSAKKAAERRATGNANPLSRTARDKAQLERAFHVLTTCQLDAPMLTNLRAIIEKLVPTAPSTPSHLSPGSSNTATSRIPPQEYATERCLAALDGQQSISASNAVDDGLLLTQNVASSLEAAMIPSGYTHHAKRSHPCANPTDRNVRPHLHMYPTSLDIPSDDVTSASEDTLLIQILQEHLSESDLDEVSDTIVDCQVKPSLLSL